MNYIEETVEEIQPDGSVMLRRVIVPVQHVNPRSSGSQPERGVTIVEIWKSPNKDAS